MWLVPTQKKVHAQISGIAKLKFEFPLLKLRPKASKIIEYFLVLLSDELVLASLCLPTSRLQELFRQHYCVHITNHCQMYFHKICEYMNTCLSCYFCNLHYASFCHEIRWFQHSERHRKHHYGQLTLDYFSPCHSYTHQSRNLLLTKTDQHYPI